MSELRFEGRVAIVTGAGRGIGRSHALALAGRGAQVVVNDLGVATEGGGRDSSVAQAVVDEIAAAGGTAVADASDIAGTAGAEALVQAALDAFDRVDVVINNAGIIRWTTFPDADLDEFSVHFAVHGGGSFNVSRAAWPHMVERGYGRIVLTTSSAWFGGENVVAYGTAKGAVVGLARSLAVAGEPHGIAANVVAPIAWTRMMESAGVKEDPELARRLRPELVSSVVAFLAHESCSANGEVFAAGGGRAARIFIGETPGYAETDLTPEAVRDNWDAVCDESGYFVPRSMVGYSTQRQEIRAAGPASGRS
jgi:NAD(P)-dependent dehydrogenase (short-subunit alcohol dehydrogenase family)